MSGLFSEAEVFVSELEQVSMVINVLVVKERVPARRAYDVL